MNSKVIGVCLLGVLLQALAAGQGKNSSSNNTGSAPSSPSALSGVTYVAGQWPNESPNAPNIRIICFSLEPTTSATQPYNFRRVGEIIRSDGTSVPCIPQEKALKMDALLVVALDARQADVSRIKLINLNLTTQTGSPISPNPIRPSFGAGSTSLNL